MTTTENEQYIQTITNLPETEIDNLINKGIKNLNQMERDALWLYAIENDDDLQTVLTGTFINTFTKEQEAQIEVSKEASDIVSYILWAKNRKDYIKDNRKHFTVRESLEISKISNPYTTIGAL